MPKEKKTTEPKRRVVRLNLSGPITILGCAAQGCEELVLEGTLAEGDISAEEVPATKPAD